MKIKKLGVGLFLYTVAAMSGWAIYSANITNSSPVATGFLIEWIPAGEAVVKWSPDLATTPFINLSLKLPATQGSYTDTVHGAADQCFYRVDFDAPPGMASIPAGSFQMGDTFGEGTSSELPVHSVYVDGFYMDKYEVTNDKMVQVMQWAYDAGKLTVSVSSVKNAQGNQQELLYLDDVGCRIIWDGSAFGIKSTKGAGYPCVEVSWYGSVAYCNYRSEMEGRTPCYNLSDWSCNYNANGYRLPTEAEWEKAARGSLNGKRFGWGDSIDYSKANYDFAPAYKTGEHPYTSPVGSFAPTGYGLYDMAGNVWEWCGDWRDDAYYVSSPATNPRGASLGSHRVTRGGCWSNPDGYCRSAYRGSAVPAYATHTVGFRSVLLAN